MGFLCVLLFAMHQLFFRGITKQADEIFIPNALLGIRAIKVLDDLVLTTPYQITDLVSAKYQEFISSKSQEYVERRSLTY